MKSEYLFAAVGVVFISVVIGLIIPEGKLKKSINFVLRLVCICVLIIPITTLFGIDEKVSGIEYDYDYICKVYAENQSALLTNKLTEELDIECVCSVDVIYDNDKIKENGVHVSGNFENALQIDKIVEYLKSLGYIDITVNDEGSKAI